MVDPRNRSIELLNLHYGLSCIAASGGATFVTAYLLHAGVAAGVVLAALAAINLGRFVIRPILVPLAVRFGLKPLVIAGTLLGCLRYPFLSEVRGIDFAFAMVCVSTALAATVYATTYNAYFAALGDPHLRGRQIGAREIMGAVASVVGPVVGGWTLAALGPRYAFYGVAAIIVVSAAPLLWTPPVAIPKSAPGAYRAARQGVLLYAADGWGRGSQAVWQIALFLSVGGQFTNYGLAIALAALVGAACSMVLGRFIDRGHGLRSLPAVIGATGLLTVFRALSYGNPALAVSANVAGSVTSSIYTPVLMTPMYNLAKSSPCALRFNVATEGGWDLGATGACLSAAAVIWSGGGMAMALLVALASPLAVWILLSRYYRRAELTAAAAGAMIDQSR